MNGGGEIKVEDLGYNELLESGRKESGLADFSIGRVTSEYRGAYRVKNPKGEYLARITGKQMFRAVSREDYPAVGDWVAITELGGGQAVIRGVLPRLTVIKRKYGDKNKVGEKREIQIIAANIDTAFVVESVDRDYNLNRFDRYFAIAGDGGVKPAIILNKIDLLSLEQREEKLGQIKNRFPGVDIIMTSTVNDQGLAELKKYIEKGRTYCFLGSSGVGKSSLINKLLGEEAIKTGNISAFSGRGKHVTTRREMYFLANGGIVIDNPGMREVGLAGVRVDGLFDEITALAQKCKYLDCTHIHEPGCEVLAAVAAGRLDKKQYANYLNLKKESEYEEMGKFEKREKDRQFGRFLKKAKEDLKRYKS